MAYKLLSGLFTLAFSFFLSLLIFLGGWPTLGRTAGLSLSDMTATAGLTLAITVVAELLVVYLNRALYGSFGQNRLWRRALRMQLTRLAHLNDQFQTVAAAYYKSTREGAAARPPGLNHRLSELHRKLAEYPADTHSVMPTRLGNVTRATEERIFSRYGLDPIIALPRLLAVLPERQLRRLSDTKAELSLFERLTLLTPIGTTAAFGSLAAEGRPLALSSPAVLAVGVVAAFGFYRAAIRAASSYGVETEVAFDLYRMDLLRQLNLGLPSDPASSRQVFRLVSALLAGQEVASSIKYEYSFEEATKEIFGAKYYVASAGAVGDGATAKKVRATSVETESETTESRKERTVTYNVEGSAGSVGQNARTESMVVYDLRGAGGEQMDLARLSQELDKLRAALRSAEASGDEKDSAVGAIADAKKAAEKGDKKGVVDSLSRAGQWVLDVAQGIGVPLAVAALKAALGLP